MKEVVIALWRLYTHGLTAIEHTFEEVDFLDVCIKMVTNELVVHLREEVV